MPIHLCFHAFPHASASDASQMVPGSRITSRVFYNRRELGLDDVTTRCIDPRTVKSTTKHRHATRIHPKERLIINIFTTRLLLFPKCFRGPWLWFKVFNNFGWFLEKDPVVLAAWGKVSSSALHSSISMWSCV